MTAKSVIKQLKALRNINFTPSIVPGAEIIMKESKRVVPVDTGFLRDSHEVVESKDFIEIQIGAPYAGSVEFGTPKQEAEPYIRPSIDNKRGEASEAIADAIRKTIVKEVG